MLSFFLRKILHFFIIINLSFFIVFSILTLTPQNAASLKLGANASNTAIAKEKKILHLNESFLNSFFDYYKNFIQGNLGVSYKSGLPVLTEIKAHLGNTLLLSFISLFFAFILGFSIGLLSAYKTPSKFERVLSFFTLLMLSFPSFLLSLLLIQFFSVKLGLLPFIGLKDIKSFVLPCFSIALVSFSSIARITKTSFLETLNKDYYKIARLNGLKKRTLFLHYLLANSFMPVLSITGFELWGFLGGTVVTETIFSFPGIGLLLTGALQQKDTPVIMGCIIVFTILFCIIHFIIDLLEEVMYRRVN